VVGALGCLGVLVGVYRMPLNRCRCGKGERLSGPLKMHCKRCLKRTPKGIVVSFVSSPLYIAGAAVGTSPMLQPHTGLVRTRHFLS